MKDQKSPRLFGSLSGYKKPHREIEVKILNIHPGQVREKLQQLEAKKKFAGEIVRVTFDFPDRRLKQNHELLRVRKLGTKQLFASREKKNMKTR